MKPWIVVGALLLLLLICWQWTGQFFYWDKGGGAAAGETEGLYGAGAAVVGVAREPPPGAVLSVEDESRPPSFPVALQYDRYPTGWLSLTVGGGGAALRQGASASVEALGRAAAGQRLDYVETVVMAGPAGPETWYHVRREGEDGPQFGFVSAGEVAGRRLYRFDRMEAAVNELDALSAEGGLAHICNYKDYHGAAPLYRGKETDAYGTGRGQSAPAYPSLEDKAEFRYLEDGTLMAVRGRAEGYVLVTALYLGESFYVPSRYVEESETLESLERVVVIDRAMQNQAVFEKSGGQWAVVSYTPVTTGKKGPYSEPTPLGYYYAMERRPEFYYVKDGTEELRGYAPYAIRFCGGAYIHGIGVDFRQAPDGSRVVPEPVEYSPTIGTVPLSHKCVRNYTSHAQFLYERYEEGATAVAVIE